MKTFNAFIVASLAIATFACQKDDSDPKLPSEGLVAYYPFNGNANDKSGKGNNGTLNSGAVLSEDRNGNASMACDVSSGYVEIPDNDLLDVESFSLSVWFRMDGVTSAFNCILGKDYTVAYSMGIESGGNGDCPAPAGTVRNLRLYIGYEENAFNTTDFECGGEDWHHVVSTYDNTTGNIKVYVNGELAGFATIPAGSIGNSASPLAIGRDGEWGDKFTGDVDDVRIYNRVLTETEIGQLFAE